MKPIEKKKVEAALRKRGYKLTPQRRAVLDVITLSRTHLTPAEIFERVGQEYPGIGLVTVYRTLEILAEAGLICEVHVGSNCRRYLLRRPSEHHHHLVCSGCGTVIDFSECGLFELEQRLSQKTGFEIKSHLLEFLGQCPECHKAELKKNP